MRNWNVRVILFCLLIQASLSFRHINILMEGQSKVNPARKSYSRADMFSSDSLYNNKLNPWSQDSRRNSFLANTAIISADTISMALLNSTIDVSDAKSSEYSWLDSLNSLSDISVLSERTNKVSRTIAPIHVSLTLLQTNTTGNIRSKRGCTSVGAFLLAHWCVVDCIRGSHYRHTS